MGKTFSTGLLTNGLWQDASNNIGIGGSPSGSYKLEVTGTLRGTGSAFDFYTSSGLGTSSASGLMRVITSGTSVGIAIGQSNNTRYTGISANEFKVYNDDFSFGTASAYPMYFTTNGTNKMTITSSGNVGIGITNPNGLLALKASVTNTPMVLFENANSGPNAALSAYTSAAQCNIGIGTNSYIDNTSNIVKLTSGVEASQIVFDEGVIRFYTSTTSSAPLVRMSINNAGSVGINGTPPSTVKLGVFGASATSSDYAFACYTNAGGNLIYVRNDGFLYSVSAWSGSDRRLKENITDLDNGLEKILGLKARKYDLIDSFKNQFGFIAQEVQEVIPDAVSVFQEETQMLAIKMDFIVPHLVKAVQELSAQNQDLKSRLDKAGL